MKHPSTFILSRNHSYPTGLCSQLFARLIIPSVVIVWVMFLMLSPSSSDSTNLRGQNEKLADRYNFQRPPLRPLIDLGSNNVASTVSKNNGIDHLIIVAGHAVMRLNQLSVADTNENAWYLLKYQLKQGFPGIISSHIQKGIEIATKDTNSLLVFSGGQTRKDVGPTSEAASYYYLAREKNWITSELTSRLYLEEYARDSFENLLFSICRFKEVQGYYPSRITVIGFDFKGERYSSLHRKAIRFPDQNFQYIGVKSSPQFDQAKAESGEKLALKSFTEDLYGCNDISLKQKRDIRNPFRRSIPYELAAPELKGLLDWCGPGMYPNKLPWNI